jgi:hypothetical protein
MEEDAVSVLNFPVGIMIATSVMGHHKLSEKAQFFLESILNQTQSDLSWFINYRAYLFPPYVPLAPSSTLPPFINPTAEGNRRDGSICFFNRNRKNAACRQEWQVAQLGKSRVACLRSWGSL